MNMKAQVRAAVLAGCNTSQDVADETGVPLDRCSDYLTSFVRKGWLRRTARRIPNNNPVQRGRPFIVFEVIP